MLKFDRPAIPNWLAEKEAKWTENWIRNKSNNKAFKWATFKGQPVNQHLNSLFQEITDLTENGGKLGHCHFCDGFPMAPNIETVEHFRPKERFPELAYQWGNLFYACQKCQLKNDTFDELLLKPDVADYSFTDYFIYIPSNGEIKPNLASSNEHQKRAEITIEIYGLNEHKRPSDRMRVFRQYYLHSDQHIDDFAYRFLFT